jgi:hypothetical protein
VELVFVLVFIFFVGHEAGCVSGHDLSRAEL